MKHINHQDAWILNKSDLRLQIRRKPFWTDACCHAKDSYIGSATYWERIPNSGSKSRQIDVYVFDQAGPSQAVCIRVSDEPSGYASPGLLLDFLIAAQRRPADYAYAAAAVVIDEFMEIKATRRC